MKTILAIEDEVSILSNILKLLEYKGFQAIGAHNGQVGIEMAHLHVPDLIICDVMMPDMDGYAVLSALRQDPETAAIPFIFLTAKADRADMRQGMNMGADDYITKPFTSTDLLEAIEARLEKQAKITQPYLDEMKQATEALSKVAYSDPLTNLPNRIMLRHRLQEMLRSAHRKQQLVGVVCLNVRQLSSVNTSLGYTAGDTLLKLMAERLSQCVGNENFVARLSGDEFCIVLQELLSRNDVETWVGRLHQAITDPYLISDQELLVQVSLGVAIYPNDSDTVDRLLSRADLARRWSRKHTKSFHEFYRPDMETVDAERRALESELVGALERRELLLFYQPQVNLITGRITGVESLLRWQHPNKGMILPNRFIPAAEETGLILSIGRWVLETACAQAKIWQGASLFPIRVAVNLSARQFKQENLPEMVTSILRATGVDPNLLVLELTETSLMDDVDATIRMLQDLKEMGVEISIDDFGTGYSSLNYLKRFPLDSLKIDQSFIQNVVDDPHDAAIATAIIAMAQSLQLKVIAEGVETQEQLAFLRKQGCQNVQGYLFSRPIPSSGIDQLLLKEQRLLPKDS